MSLLQKQITLDFDHRYWLNGIDYLCGIDEVGRGALAGPVVAVALILRKDTLIKDLNDSKKLSAAKREYLVPLIEEAALDYGIGCAQAVEIDRINIREATFLAMKRAVDQLTVRPQFLLVDGRDFPCFIDRFTTKIIPGQSIVKGDQRSAHIAGASILAKVYRDRLMTELAEQYPHYRFDKHKGYGTLEHREKILTFGANSVHRLSFLKRIQEQILL